MDRKIIESALAKYAKCLEFDLWSDRIDLSDPFNQELVGRYQKEQDVSRDKISAAIYKAILRTAKRYNVRFVSISKNDLITLEDIRYPPILWEESWSGWPVAWHITKVLGIDWGAGSPHQHQVRLPELLAKDWALYDVRGEKPIVIGKYLSLRTDCDKSLGRVFRDENETLTQYLLSLGIRSINAQT
jgi:hypothetical protein